MEKGRERSYCASRENNKDIFSRAGGVLVMRQLSALGQTFTGYKFVFKGMGTFSLGRPMF